MAGTVIKTSRSHLPKGKDVDRAAEMPRETVIVRRGEA